MKNFEIEALRRLLFFSVPEAAALVGGVSEQAWRRWEAGSRAVPDDVSERISDLIRWRNQAISNAEYLIEGAGGNTSVALVWYSSIDDWLSIPGRESVMWRPHQSVCASLAGDYAEFEGGVTLVEFDGRAYAAWLAGRPDNETARSQWAAAVAG